MYALHWWPVPHGRLFSTASCLYFSYLACFTLVSVFFCRNQAKPSDSKDEVAKAAAKAEKEKKDAMANIDINNYASMCLFYTQIYSLLSVGNIKDNMVIPSLPMMSKTRHQHAHSYATAA